MLSILRQRSIVSLRKLEVLCKNEKSRLFAAGDSQNISKNSSRNISIIKNVGRNNTSDHNDVILRGDYIKVSAEVNNALVDNKPIVALESTIITHGMPYPKNLETARAVEKIVRKQGAVPATIAIINGKISVGLDSPSLEAVAKGLPGLVKVSRRDLPRVLALNMNGGTTVSATMAVAHMMGIHVFVTGGIGGVHRCGESTMDISADLTEFGRTPVCVVSSGVKSILDIERTLEYLETQGACVATYGPNNDFPAFFTRRSGFQSPGCVNNPVAAAQMIKAAMDFKLNSGILLAVPVPEQYSLDETIMENAIQEALKRAESAGIKGRDITPFLLSAMSSITEGKSLQTNIALIKNNAEIGAQIAVELSKMIDKPKREFIYDAHNVSEIFVAECKEVGNERDGTIPVKCIRPVVVGGKNADYTIKIEEDDVKNYVWRRKSVEEPMTLRSETNNDATNRLVVLLRAKYLDREFAVLLWNWTTAFYSESSVYNTAEGTLV